MRHPGNIQVHNLIVRPPQEVSKIKMSFFGISAIRDKHMESYMRLVKPSYKILDFNTPEEVDAARKKIELFGRTSYQSFDFMQEGSHLKFCEARGLKGNKHWSIFRCVPIMVVFTVDRGVSHELVRHHVGFDPVQESTRFCNYSRETGRFGGHITCVIPSWVKFLQEGTYTLVADGYHHEESDRWIGSMYGGYHAPIPEDMFLDHLMRTEDAYKAMARLGRSPDEMRGFLTHFTKAEVAVCANIEAWRNVIEKRSQPDVHEQFRTLVTALGDELSVKMPEAFGDFRKE